MNPNEYLRALAWGRQRGNQLDRRPINGLPDEYKKYFPPANSGRFVPPPS
jgi:hypothetical protein